MFWKLFIFLNLVTFLKICPMSLFSLYSPLNVVPCPRPRTCPCYAICPRVVCQIPCSGAEVDGELSGFPSALSGLALFYWRGIPFLPITRFSGLSEPTSCMKKIITICACPATYLWLLLSPAGCLFQNALVLHFRLTFQPQDLVLDWRKRRQD